MSLQCRTTRSAKFLRYIRDRAPLGITVADLIKKFPISRRRLEQRFRAELNRSPAEEIRRVGMAHAGRLLLDSDKPVATVAAEAGFAVHLSSLTLNGEASGLR